MKKSNREFELHKQRVALTKRFVEFLHKRIGFLQKLKEVLDSNIPNQKKVTKCIKLLEGHLTVTKRELDRLQKELNRIDKALGIA